VTPTLVGLTGGIAAGKSEVLRAFERAGAATLATDAVVHDLLATPELRDLIVERWGEDVTAGEEIDRARVAEIVFERPEELRWLEAELHPRVAERMAAWRAGLPAETTIAVVEVPLLFETGMEGVFEAVVCVVAPDGQRERRAGGSGLAGLEGRESRQLSQSEKAARATHVLSNEGTLAELDEKVADLIAELESIGGDD
jgi:dephospho-CoA kinase